MFRCYNRYKNGGIYVKENNDENNLEENGQDPIQASDSSTELEALSEQEETVAQSLDYVEVSTDSGEVLENQVEDEIVTYDKSADDSNISQDSVDHKSSDQSEDTSESDEILDKSIFRKNKRIAIIVIVLLLLLVIISNAVLGMTGSSNLPSASYSLTKAIQATSDLEKDNDQKFKISVKGLGIDAIMDILIDKDTNKIAANIMMSSFQEKTKLDAYIINFEIEDLSKALIAITLDNEIEVYSWADFEFQSELEEAIKNQSTASNDILLQIEKYHKQIDRAFQGKQEGASYVYSLKKPYVFKVSDLAALPQYADMASQLQTLGTNEVRIDMSFRIDQELGYLDEFEFTIEIMSGISYNVKLEQTFNEDVNIKIPSEIQLAFDNFKK